MKATGLFLALLLSLPAWGDNVISKRLVDIGDTKAVIFEETVSPDGRYAMGWTLRLRNKSVKPVDWSLWKPDDATAIDNFVKIYIHDSDDFSSAAEYELVNCLIDLKGKSLVDLPTDDPDYPHKNHGYIRVAWSPANQGTRYVLIESDARFNTDNLWLVAIDSSGMHPKDIAADLQKAVDPIIAEKRPLAHNAYETVFSLGPDSNESPPFAFHGSTFTVPFFSDIPKSAEDYTAVEGTLTVKLPQGIVLRAVSDTPRDDPFQDDHALSQADHDLNQVYEQLGQKLSSKQKNDLKHEEHLWIIQRDNDAAYAWSISRQDSSAHDPRDYRNNSLLESTQKRVKELQPRLDALK